MNCRTMRLGIFGGSFNPIHNGHIQLAAGMIEKLNLDRLLLIPVKMPPHKIPGDFASPEQRMEMCRLAGEGIPRIEVSGIEISREGKSYTIDTLKQIKQLEPDAEIFLIIGGDMLLSFETWRDVPELLRLAVICAAPRDTDTRNLMVAKAKKLEAIGGRVILPELPVLELSSTAVRTLIAKGKSTAGMIPPKVEQYIAEQKLYIPNG